MLKRAGVMPAVIVTIHTSMIHSVLEYACQVWHTALPQFGSLPMQLEVVQRISLRIVQPDMSCRETLQVAGLETLDGRKVTLCKGFFSDRLRGYSLLAATTKTPALHSEKGCQTQCPMRAGTR